MNTVGRRQTFVGKVRQECGRAPSLGHGVASVLYESGDFRSGVGAIKLSVPGHSLASFRRASLLADFRLPKSSLGCQTPLPATMKRSQEAGR